MPLFHSNTTGHMQSFDAMAFGKRQLMTAPLHLLIHNTDLNDDQTAAGYAEQLDFSLLLAGDDYQTSSFTAVNDAAPSATVSPHDLFLDHELSAPNSNALTNLTTPSLYNDTPDLSYDVSPAFGTNDMDMNDWPPLFPDQHFGSAAVDNSEPPSMTSSITSLPNHSFDLTRTPSNSSTHPVKADVLRQRLSLTSGIHKSRRTLKDLSPIQPNTEDETAVKRARNTMAARKSRQKKRDVEDSLRDALEAMTAERDHWRLVAIKHGAPIPEL